MSFKRILVLVLGSYLVFVHATDAFAYSGEDLVAKMDPSAPKYDTPECQAARDAANSYGGNDLARIGLGALLGATLGIFGLPIAAAADYGQYSEGQRIANNLLAACGPEAFFPIYLERAEDGHADAEAWVGQAYVKGYGCPKDFVKAIYWYQKSADAGNDQARINLGALYYDGIGTPHDYAKAIALWQDAADDDQPSAQVNLAQAYIEGKAVPPDYDKAIELLSKAAKINHASAQYALGELHEEGKGFPKSDIDAYKWYSIAAINGYADANPKRDEAKTKLTADQVEEMDEAAQKCMSSHFRRCQF